MNRSAKALLILFALLVALPTLAWTGTFLYWHVTIKRELREMGPHRPASYGTVSGGCRSLPYCIEALETAHDPWVMDSLDWQIVSQIEASGRPASKQEMTEFWLLSMRHSFDHDAAPEVRRANYRKILAWWKANQEKYHQWWRVWSPCCGS